MPVVQYQSLSFFLSCSPSHSSSFQCPSMIHLTNFPVLFVHPYPSLKHECGGLSDASDGLLVSLHRASCSGSVFCRRWKRSAAMWAHSWTITRSWKSRRSSSMRWSTASECGVPQFPRWWGGRGPRPDVNVDVSWIIGSLRGSLAFHCSKAD